MSAASLCQNTKADSTTISNKALDLIIKDLKKCDSTKVALVKKNKLIEDLTDNTLKMFSDFSKEREIKTQAIKAKKELQKKLDKFDRKRFGIGISMGQGLIYQDNSLSFVPTISISIHYSIFRF